MMFMFLKNMLRLIYLCSFFVVIGCYKPDDLYDLIKSGEPYYPALQFDMDRCAIEPLPNPWLRDGGSNYSYRDYIYDSCPSIYEYDQCPEVAGIISEQLFVNDYFFRCTYEYEASDSSCLDSPDGFCITSETCDGDSCLCTYAPVVFLPFCL